MAKTIKRSKERKQDLVREVRESVDTYSNLFVFSINNMRNNRLKDLRAHWNTSRYANRFESACVPCFLSCHMRRFPHSLCPHLIALSHSVLRADSTLARTR